MINSRGALVALLAIIAILSIAFSAHARPHRAPAICRQIQPYVDRFGESFVENYARSYYGWSDRQIAALKRKCKR